MGLDPRVESRPIGGGPAGPLAEDFTSFLRAFIGGAPMERTGTIGQALSRIIAGEDISGQERALQSLIQADIGRQSADIRERFGAGGIGTPAAVAESLFRAEAAPRATLAIAELRRAADMQRLQAILPILSAIQGLSALGIPQAEIQTLVKDPRFMQVLGVIKGLAEAGGAVAKAAKRGG